MPLQITIAGQPRGFPLPAENEPAESFGTGFSAAANLGFQSGIGTAGAWAFQEATAGGSPISYEEAAENMKAQGYDAGALPREGLTTGALQVIMDRQGDLRRSQYLLSRSKIGTVGSFTASLMGGLGDPLNIALAPIGGGEVAIGRSALVRLGIGAAKGGAIMGGLEVPNYALHQYLADDYSLYDSFRNVAFGAALGGGLHVAFGPRAFAAVPGGSPLTLSEIAGLERSASYAAAHGITEAQVVSPAGAVGRYQIMPATAKAYGFDPKRLTDAAYNEQVATKILADLEKKFPGDAEAQAIAYNAGPGAAAKWIRAGRDLDELPLETQGYVARLRQMRGATLAQTGDGEVASVVANMPEDARREIAKTALAQALNDSPVNVEPFFSAPLIDENEIRLLGREAQLRSDLEGVTAQLETAPKPTAEARTAAERLNRLEAVESQLEGTNLSDAERRALYTRRDQLLESTNPETLREISKPIGDLREMERNKSRLSQEHETTKAELARLRAEKLAAPRTVQVPFGATGRVNLADAIPERNANFQDATAVKVSTERHATLEATEKAGVERLAKAGPKAEGPLATQATEAANEAVEEAKQLAPRIGEVEAEGLKIELEDADASIFEHMDFVKAVSAAVRCALTKGIAYGT